MQYTETTRIQSRINCYTTATTNSKNDLQIVFFIPQYSYNTNFDFAANCTRYIHCLFISFSQDPILIELFMPELYAARYAESV